MAAPQPAAGLTALVTGASSGIGTEFAQQLAARGWHVTLVARRREKLESIAKGIVSGGGQADVVACDLADDDIGCATSLQLNHDPGVVRCIEGQDVNGPDVC